MNNEIRLEAPRLWIRTLHVEDICDDYVAGLNDSEVRRYLFDVRFAKQTWGTVAGFIRMNLESPADIFFGLFEKKGGLLIGTIRISGISKIHFSCNLGICIFRKSFWNKGLGTEAVCAVVEYLFKEMGLHYVEAGAYKDNIGSVTLFQKAGFILQAEYPNKFRYETDFRPMVILGKTNDAFDFSLLSK